MIIEETSILLKDGRAAVLRSPLEDDAEEMLQFIIKASEETDFLMKYPEEYADFTLEREKSILRSIVSNSNSVMAACLVNGRIAGNCTISFNTGIKDRHRASVAIALLQEYWGQGIGTRMFEELFHIARERPDVRQIELEFIEGNTRARGLYEKMGFRITGVKPDAIRLKDGRFLNEYMMVKKL